MSEESEAQGRATPISAEALEELPIFPLPGSVLLPRTFMSLHIFEPRYRRMVADCIDGHRMIAVGMLDEGRRPDRYGRPAVHPVAGVGVLRRSAKLPDGRYNIVLEGLARVHVGDELPPELPYRRARAKVLTDELPTDPRSLETSLASLRSLCTRVIGQMAPADAEIMQKLNQVSDPGSLADLIAAAAVQDAEERQRILAAIAVARRVDLAAAALGALLLKADTAATPDRNVGWGITTGKA